MTTDKLKQLIADENERLEENLVDQARAIIAKIGRENQAIAEHQAHIAELQAELRKLEVTPLDPVRILGA